MSETATRDEATSVVDSERRRRNLRAVTLLRKWLEEPDEPPRGHTGEEPSEEDFIPSPIRLRDIDVLDS